MNQRRWVIPDIHGCSKTLRALIELQIKPRGSDELWFLGDYIDRGPDSKGVIDYLMELQLKEFNLKLLIGNHEEYCIKAWEEDRKSKRFLGIRFKSKIQKIWELHGGAQTLESFGLDFAGDIPEHYIAWMRKLRYYAELENYILVHAGLNFGIEDPLADRFAMLWTKDFKVDPAKIRHKKIIHGHTPVDLEFLDHVIRSGQFHFIDLDNGVYITDRPGYGNLTAFELNSGQLLVQPNVDF
jgi:serine/threonine protein phosphatase 1